MRTEAFRAWLTENYSPASADTHFYSAKKVEVAYGDLDDYYQKGELEGLAIRFNYSTSDAKSGTPNPTKIETGGSLYSNLAGFKSAIRCYKKFRDSGVEASAETTIELAGQAIKDKREGKQFEVERHLQEEIRREIGQLQNGLTIIDGGVERSVESGFIDILAQDQAGALVVIELKSGLAKREAIGQIVGYMGDLMAEEPGVPVRGILVAADFDKSCRSGVRAIPTLNLKRYRFSFSFEEA